MQFIIVNVNESFAPVFDAEGNLLIFDEGKAAADFAKQREIALGMKFQPRPQASNHHSSQETSNVVFHKHGHASLNRTVRSGQDPLMGRCDARLS